MSVAKLRFKEFDGNWASLKIKDLVKSLDAGVSVNSEDVEPQDDEYSVLKTSCISSGYFDGNERKRVLQDIEIQRLKEPVLDDSILMSRMNTPMLVGMNAYVFKAPKNTFLPDRLWQLKINDNKTVTRWLAFYLGSDQGLNQIRDLASGTSNSMKNITKPDVLNLDLFVPSKPEQTKIASFLSAVDEKISQLTRKHELLSQYKQGMMQKLFSQQIRFKADDGSEFGEWEEKTIQYFLDQNYILDQMDGNHGELYPKSEEFSDSGIPYIGATDFSNGAVNFLSCKKIPLGRALKFKKGIAKNGDVLFAHNATVGPVALLITDLEFVILSTTATYYRCNPKKIINIYLKSALESDYFKKQYVGIMSQSTRNQVPITTQRKLNLVVPCLEEQTKIANFLSAIDQKVDVVAQQIEQAKQWKKGLLQKMFV